MIKKLLFILLFTIAAGKLFSQTISRDSARAKGKADARHFRLDRTDMQSFRRDKKNFMADYFKPTKATTEDTALLTNKEYIDAYVMEAYRRTSRRRTTGHYILLGGVAYLTIGLIVGLAAIGSALK